MKTLIYGAGVLGSLLAHELCRGNHEVTLLARGKHYESLKSNGLVIQHIRQKKRTVDKVAVVDSLLSSDYYDLIFITVQASQIKNVMPIIAKNEKSPMIVFIGNNCKADKIYSTFMEISAGKPSVLFGFLGCAGHRDNHVVYNWHSNNCVVSIGALNELEHYKKTIVELFTKTSLRIDYKKDINAWLKYHCAIITPICLALQYENGASHRLRKSEALQLAIESFKESIKMFEAKGFYNESPHNMKLFRWPSSILQWIFARLLPTKMGHYIAVDHALVARKEIDLLTQELLSYSDEYSYPIHSLKKLYRLVKEQNYD